MKAGGSRDALIVSRQVSDNVAVSPVRTSYGKAVERLERVAHHRKPIRRDRHRKNHLPVAEVHVVQDFRTPVSERSSRAAAPTRADSGRTIT